MNITLNKVYFIWSTIWIYDQRNHKPSNFIPEIKPNKNESSEMGFTVELFF